MSKVVIIGGGAAGMFASIFAARAKHEVHVYEKNEKLGKKLFITGKGRCNITNACEDMEVLFQSICSNSKFLYSAFYTYSNQDVIRFFQQLGLPVKVERGERVFPVSDHSSDVIAALTKEMRRLGVKVHLSTTVTGLLQEEDAVKGILLGKEKVMADAVIVATGGLSYQTTGSTGDGHHFAEKTGHKVTPCYPSLVPMNAKEEFVKELQGLSLRNVSIRILDGKKTLYQEFGEMLFTHYGVSGPLILTASSKIGPVLRKKEVKLQIDLKPALSEEALDARILREFEQFQNKQFKNAIVSLFPSKLLPVMIELSGILPEKKVNEITKAERLSFCQLIKNLEITLTGLRDFNEAIITKGGVSVKEINPSTMESKKISNLYFIGEVLDLDAVTGGFNLQIAWSTGYVAANSIPL